MKLRPRALAFALLTCLPAAGIWLTGCGDDHVTANGIDVEDGSLRGVLAIYMSDDLEGRSDTRYALRAPSGLERSLLFDHDVSDLIPGAELKVWGPETAAGVKVTSYRVVSPPFEERTSALQAGPAFADRAFAFVLVDIGGGINVTPDVVMGRMVNDANSIRNYYLYDSYGRQNISAQVITGLSYPMTTCDTSGMTRTLKPQITGTFQHYLWYFGSRLSACAWAGLASVGTAARPSADTWYNASTGCVVLVQEPGHNFGMQHSSSVRCAGTPLADDTMTCTASEYGDVFDPMGGGCKHMNAWQKAYQGWFGGCNGVNITASGTFTLLPFEMRCDGAQFLQIPAPKTRTIARSGGGGAASTETLTTYFVELRTPLDFDGTLGGGTSLTPRVLLHIANDVRGATQRAIHPYLIDMTPATTSFNDAALAVGQTFTDPAGGLTITATAVSATQATIDVTVTGGSGAPTCLDDTPLVGMGAGPESCVANGAVPTGVAAPPGSGGAPGTGTGGRGGTGGRTGTGGTAGRAATGGAGGTTTGVGGSGGAPGTPGTGGAIIVGGTGGSTGGSTSGSGGSGGPIGGIGTGGGVARADAAVVGANPDVAGGCGCAMNAGSPSGSAGFAIIVAMVLGAAGARRRKRK